MTRQQHLLLFPAQVTSRQAQTVQDLVDGLNAIAGVRAEFDKTGDLTVYVPGDFHITDGSVTATLGSFNFDASALTATTQLLSETGPSRLVTR
ncbi:hypothetical protein [Roseibium album]|uniref:hypothetical protein n=1 Tax=Roseibium album TaxID=311410 RepID=UPI00391AA618